VSPGAVIRCGASAFRVDAVDEPAFVSISERTTFGELVGASLEMRQVYAVLERVAPTDTTLLVQGETGTGKDVVARAVHAESKRAAGPFVPVDCGAIPENLFESELFGHVRGAFTGAVQNRVGAFEEASGGTLFLDEISETTPGLQVKLLRALQEGEIRRVGDNHPFKVSGRLLAATNKDLTKLVAHALPGVEKRVALGPTDTAFVTDAGQGDVVVLVSGLLGSSYQFRRIAHLLVDEGFRVLAPELPGVARGSRSEQADYSLAAQGDRIIALLDSLGIREPVDLAGLSFGAAIVTDFADVHPDRVRSLIYIDPVFNTGRQLRAEERSALAWDWYMVFRGGTEAMAADQLYDFLHPERHPDWVARYRVQQQFRGTREALRRTRAAIAVAPPQSSQLLRVGGSARPVLVIWGRQDEGAPITESTALLAAMPRAVLLPVDSAGHLPHLEQPGVVVPAVEAFLQSP